MNDTRPIDCSHHSEKVHATAFIAAGAVVTGNVTIGMESSVWFHSVVRGDTEAIVIGNQTNIQDGSILHADPGTPCILGNRVTVGHGAVVHGAIIEDDVLIGIHATILNGAVIGQGSVIAAGCVIAPGTVIPKQSVVMGIPGKVVRPAGKDEERMIADAAEHYCEYARMYRT
ncbi:MAG: gamma carbonic anhydrase family protein [Nitrospirota bacterium]